MLINISFYEASNYTFDNPEELINYLEKGNKDIMPEDYEKINDIGKELESILNEDYFGGANGAVYAGFDLNNEVFNYKLFPG